MLIVAAAVVLLMMNAGDFSGLLATIMFAMTVGMRNRTLVLFTKM